MPLHATDNHHTNFEAWKKGLQENSDNPLLKNRLAKSNKRFYSSFSQHYEKLSSLPRKARRAMQRKWKHSLAGIALVLALGASPALGAEIDVVDGGCTLVDAITAANTDTPTGDCSAGSGPDIINLPVNSLQELTVVNNNDFGPTGLPVITTDITIEGNGSEISRDNEADPFRIIAIDGATESGDLTLNETTISGGTSDYGGGIHNEEGTVTITSSMISGNYAEFYGGGINNDLSTATITGSNISGNTTASSGGGIYNDGTATITGSTVSGNTSEEGGGIHNEGTTTITNSTISGNTADFGGGVSNSFGTSTIASSTISGNTANEDGGGISNDPDGTSTITNSTISGNTAGSLGGGIFTDASTKITNCTLSENTADFGGGLFNFGTAEITSSTISDNQANMDGGGVQSNSNEGITDIQNSIITDNTAPDGANCFIDFDGTINNNGYNIEDQDTCGFSGTSMANTDSLLDPAGLQDNGGPTRTIALCEENGIPAGCTGTSPAIDEILNGESLCATTEDAIETDQRFFPRPADGGVTAGNCDIGAFELQPTASVTITKDTDPPGGTGFDFTIEGMESTNGGDIESSFTLDDGDTESTFLPLGEFTITELPPVNTAENQVSIQCSEQTDDLQINDDDGSITFTVDEEGETVNCTFVNFTPQMVFEIVELQPGNAECPEGGVRIDEGTDLNENGELDPDEVEEETFVCDGDDGQPGQDGQDGPPGQDGEDIVFNTVPEPAGPNCANGGTKVEIGTDTNGNGELDTTEVENTFFTCNGAPGPESEPEDGGSSSGSNAGSGSGGEGCSLAAESNSKSAISNIFVSMLPAIAGFAGLFWRRRR